MNDAPTIFISLLIGLFLGVAGTYVLSDFFENREFQEVVNSHPSITFDECEGIPNELQETCANNVLFRKAQQENNEELCQNITVESQKTSCIETLGLLNNFDRTSQDFCVGRENRDLCLELLEVLAADLAQDATACASIPSQVLREFCSSRLPVDIVEVEENQQLLANRFGPVCPEDGGEVCNQRSESVKQAILSGDIANCQNTGIFSDLCVLETELYALYLGEGLAGCDSLQEGLPVRDESLSIQSLLTKNVCISQLELAAQDGVGRFDYLN